MLFWSEDALWPNDPVDMVYSSFIIPDRFCLFDCQHHKELSRVATLAAISNNCEVS